MRKCLCATLVAVLLFFALSAVAQNPNYDPGPIWRVVYYRIKPGQAEAFWKDYRDHLKPSYDALKKEGIISDVKWWTNVTTDNPQDWDVALALIFPNWAALDKADTRAATVLAQHYGSRDAMIEAGKKRNDLREVVASKLGHEIMPK